MRERMPTEVHAACDTLKSYVAQWLLVNKGKIVATPGGKFKGRSGVVDSAYMDIDDWINGRPTLRVLVMTLRKDGAEVLNSHCDTRSYWRLEEIPELSANIAKV